MGYDTSYNLTASRDGFDVIDEVLPALEEISGYGADRFTGGDSCHWYDHDDDMIELSHKFPDVEFRLYGEGEESGDVWVHWFKDGQMQAWSLELNIPDAPPNAWESV